MFSVFFFLVNVDVLFIKPVGWLFDLLLLEDYIQLIDEHCTVWKARKFVSN